MQGGDREGRIRPVEPSQVLDFRFKLPAMAFRQLGKGLDGNELAARALVTFPHACDHSVYHEKGDRAAAIVGGCKNFYAPMSW